MTTLRVAIPAMDEEETLPVTLEALVSQKNYPPFEVYVCVNQPDSYWSNPEKLLICQRNQRTLAFLRNYDFLTVHVIDRSSRGCGWTEKKKGVGFARKVLFEQILEDSEADDIIVSLDADTYVKPDYLRTISDNFAHHPSLNAIAVPYYHPLNTVDEVQGRAMLRYELYMRNYAINLLKINSPYGFTALGSAIAMRARALRKIGNITPLQSGEDFYLVQKFCKMGGLSLFNTECVYPAGRYSDRVPFGTGPAMRRGAEGIWDSYPIYSYRCFEPIQDAYNSLQALYENRISVTDNEFLSFLQKDGDKMDIWTDIRRNVADFDHFVKAFHQKADGLRILQFVRAKHRQQPVGENIALYENIHYWLPETCPLWLSLTWPLQDYSLAQVDELRCLLFDAENEQRKQYYSTE
jgi:glycosyltransferase involved in cell wall biosynthesis